MHGPNNVVNDPRVICWKPRSFLKLNKGIRDAKNTIPNIINP